MKMTDEELLKKAYLERREDALTMALAERLETLLEGLANLTDHINQVNE